MSIEKVFSETILVAITDECKDLLKLRELLVMFKHRGMNKEHMLECLENLRQEVNADTEDTLLELMDFITGYCSPSLSIFHV